MLSLELRIFLLVFFHRGFFVVLDFIVHFFFNANIVHVPLIQIYQCRFYSICNAHAHIVIFCFLFIFIICSLAHYILSSPYSRLPTEECSTETISMATRSKSNYLTVYITISLNKYFLSF